MADDTERVWRATAFPIKMPNQEGSLHQPFKRRAPMRRGWEARMSSHHRPFTNQFRKLLKRTGRLWRLSDMFIHVQTPFAIVLRWGRAGSYDHVSPTWRLLRIRTRRNPLRPSASFRVHRQSYAARRRCSCIITLAPSARQGSGAATSAYRPHTVWCGTPKRPTPACMVVCCSLQTGPDRAFSAQCSTLNVRLFSPARRSSPRRRRSAP